MAALLALDRFVDEGSIPSRAFEIQARLATIEFEKTKLTQRRNELFPIEQDAIRLLDRPIADLALEERVLTNDAVLLDAGYTQLALDPLRWRTQEGLPQFAIFSIESPQCMFRVEVGRGGYSRRFPKQIISPKGLEATGDLFACFDDVMALLKSNVCRRKSASGFQLRARYSGLIPEVTRQKIRRAKDLGVFQHIFIISEVDWAVEKIPNDPLVTGWDGQKLWLVDKFDTTPLEALIAQTFGARTA
jgi:hypothetical protein